MFAYLQESRAASKAKLLVEYITVWMRGRIAGVNGGRSIFRVRHGDNLTFLLQPFDDSQFVLRRDVGLHVDIRAAGFRIAVGRVVEFRKKHHPRFR
jgi:hypothetical protein